MSPNRRPASAAPSIIFDFDGTLVDSAPSMTRALNAMAELRGADPVDVESVRRWVSLGGIAMLQGALGAGVNPIADLDELRALLRDQTADQGDLYPQVPETLDALKHAGYRLGICTNKREDLAIPYASGLGIAGYLDCIVGGTPERSLKPDPQLARLALQRLDAKTNRTIFVGDSEVDAQTASAVGIPFVLVTFGYPLGDINSISAHARLDRFTQLPGIAAALIPIIE